MERKKVKIGVFGGGRGSSMIKYCTMADNAELVAICDRDEEVLKRQKAEHKKQNITYYSDFEDFIKHDMDAVVLANCANQHAPFAIKCMKAKKHVFSEVLPCQTMKEAVELVEAVEETGMIYAYGENYCYMPAPYEMRKLYREGKIGEFEYGEGEYVHNCESIWPQIAYGDKNHWRNNLHSNFYCTHSIGPLIHITGLRPVSVVGFESKTNSRCYRMGRHGALFGMEMIELENGALVKSVHGDLYKDSIWYSVYGSKGRMESAREDTQNGAMRMLYVNADEFSGQYEGDRIEAFKPNMGKAELDAQFGHGGSDYYSMWHFAEKILGNEKADIIDVYEALDMYLPGMFAYRSVLAGGKKMEIPNLRNKEEREKWRFDTTCTDPEVAGDMYVPSFSKGNLEIKEEVYESQRKKFEEFRENEMKNLDI